jgi:hypothetical protein
MALNEKAIKVNPHVSTWTGRKKDKAIQNDVRDHFAPDNMDAETMGHFWKLTVDKNHLKKITRIEGMARTFHYANTLPWDKSGWALLTTKNFQNYMQTMGNLKKQFDDAVEEFLTVYPEIITSPAEQKRLGKSYNIAEYPPVAVVREKFNFEVETALIEDTDVRVKLSEAEINRIKAEVTEREKIRIEGFTMECWNRLYKVVSHMATTLNDPDAKFKNTLTGNVAKLSDILDKLNVNENPDFTAMVAEVQKNLLVYEPDELREDEEARLLTAKRADDILNKMKGFI